MISMIPIVFCEWLTIVGLLYISFSNSQCSFILWGNPRKVIYQVVNVFFVKCFLLSCIEIKLLGSKHKLGLLSVREHHKLTKRHMQCCLHKQDLMFSMIKQLLVRWSHYSFDFITSWVMNIHQLIMKYDLHCSINLSPRTLARLPAND